MRRRRRSGQVLLWLLAGTMMIGVISSLVLPIGSVCRQLLQKVRLERAATELMQDIYRVQTQNYGSGAEDAILRIGTYTDHYIIDNGMQGYYTKRFEKVHFSSAPGNLAFHKDGSPYVGGHITIYADEGEQVWTITILPITGRVAIKRM